MCYAWAKHIFEVYDRNKLSNTKLEQNGPMEADLEIFFCLYANLPNSLLNDGASHHFFEPIFLMMTNQKIVQNKLNIGNYKISWSHKAMQ